MVAGYWLLVTGQGHFNPQQATSNQQQEKKRAVPINRRRLFLE